MLGRTILAGLLAGLLVLLGAPPAAAQLTLLASGTRTVAGTGTTIAYDQADVDEAVFFLDVTAAATEAGDLLKVFIQHSPDGGTTWDDFVRFTDVTGSGGAVKHLAFWTRNVAPETEMRTPQDTTLSAAGVVQGPVAGKWRVKWTVTQAVTNGNESWTFSVKAAFQRTR